MTLLCSCTGSESGAPINNIPVYGYGEEMLGTWELIPDKEVSDSLGSRIYHIQFFSDGTWTEFTSSIKDGKYSYTSDSNEKWYCEKDGTLLADSAPLFNVFTLKDYSCHLYKYEISENTLTITNADGISQSFKRSGKSIIDYAIENSNLLDSYIPY